MTLEELREQDRQDKEFEDYMNAMRNQDSKDIRNEFKQCNTRNKRGNYMYQYEFKRNVINGAKPKMRN